MSVAAGASAPTGAAFRPLVLAPLFALVVALLSPAVLGDGDTFWHLAAGNWIIAHRAVPTQDVFSFTMAGAPWSAHEWFSEILMAGVFAAAGWSGLVALFGAALAGAFVILARRVSASGLSDVLALCLLILAFSLVSASVLARPHLLVLPLLAIWTSGLIAAREAFRTPPLTLAPVMLLWVNMHASFLLGLALIGPFALEAFFAAPREDRLIVFLAWTRFAGFATLLALFNPQGFEAFLFPLHVTGMKALSSIVEWRPARFDIFGPMQLVLLALIGTALLRPIRLQPVRLALLLGLIHMALHQGRHQMVLGVIAPMLLAEPLAQAFAEDRRAEADDRRVWRGASVLMAFLIAVRLLLPIARVDGPTAPISALSAVPGTLRQKPVFNELGFGGYLIFSGVKPYIDGRFDMYGDAYFTRQDAIVTGDVAAFDAEVARHGIAWTLLPPSAPLNRVLAGRADWKRIFGDEIAVIYAKR